MKPKLREDCLVIEADDGVYLETPGDSLLLTGTMTYRLLDHLVPFLDGTQTLAALTGGLPESHSSAVTDLISVLHEHGMVRDLETDLPDGLTAAERETYAEEIAFIDATTGSGGHRFEQFRNGRVLVLGEGALSVALPAALRGLGLRSPSVAPEAIIAAIHAAHSDRLGRLPELIAGYDAVVYGADRPMLGQAAGISRAAAQAGVPAVQAVVVAGNAWIGPIGSAPGRACWECGWWRLLGTIASDEPGWATHGMLDQPDAPPERYLSGRMIAQIAATLALGYFRTITRSDVDGSRAELVRIKLRSAECTSHPFLPHPRCASHGVPLMAWSAARPGYRMATPSSEAAAELTAKVVGELQALRNLDEAGHQQLPLCVVEATVADLAARGVGPRTVVAAGATNADARRRSVTLAGELAAEELIHWYAAAAPDGPPVGAVSAGAGESAEEAAGRALLRLCHRLVVADGPRWRHGTVAPVDGSTAGPLAASALLLADDLLTVDLAGPEEAGFATVAIRAGDAVLAAVSAPTRPAALQAALEFAVLRLQGARPVHAELAPDLGVAAWTDLLPALERWLAGRSRPAWLLPVDFDESLAQLAPTFAAALIGPRSAEER